jgi:hypothetical protein
MPVEDAAAGGRPGGLFEAGTSRNRSAQPRIEA